jgi:hypothetical protein
LTVLNVVSGTSILTVLKELAGCIQIEIQRDRLCC